MSKSKLGQGVDVIVKDAQWTAGGLACPRLKLGAVALGIFRAHLGFKIVARRSPNLNVAVAAKFTCHRVEATLNSNTEGQTQKI